MIEQIKELYGAGMYVAVVDGRPALIPKSARLGAYHLVRRAMEDGQAVSVVPQVRLDAPRAVIDAGGSDEVTVVVEVRGAEGLESIDLSVGGLIETVALIDGKGVLGPLAAEGPGEIMIEVADQGDYHGAPFRLVATDPDKKDKVKRLNGRLVLSDLTGTITK